MKTIEARAYEAVGHPKKGGMQVSDHLLLEEQTFVNGFIKGATEQKAIDDEDYRKDMRYVGVKREELIDKATDWFAVNWRKYIDQDADGMIRFSGWKSDFVKAMKDETRD